MPAPSGARLDRGIGRSRLGSFGSPDPSAAFARQRLSRHARTYGTRRLAVRAAASHHCGGEPQQAGRSLEKYKPKKQEQASWREVARALTKTRMLAKDASFGDDLRQAYGIVWQKDLFAPADEDSRYTNGRRSVPRRSAGVAVEQPTEARRHHRGQWVWSCIVTDDDGIFGTGA